MTRCTLWHTSRVAWRAVRPPESSIRRRAGGRHPERNTVPPAGGHRHAPGWPIARVTAYLLPSDKIEAVKVHHLAPGCDEVTHEFLLCVVLRIDFGQRA